MNSAKDALRLIAATTLHYSRLAQLCIALERVHSVRTRHCNCKRQRERTWFNAHITRIEKEVTTLAMGHRYSIYAPRCCLASSNFVAMGKKERKEGRKKERRKERKKSAL